jgi:hypothetical protein
MSAVLSALLIGATMIAGSGRTAYGATNPSPQQLLERIVIPEIDLRNASLPEAISTLNAAIAKAVTNGTPPVIELDLTPTKVTMTRAPHGPELDSYMTALDERWRKRHAWRIMSPQKLEPITFSARYMSTYQALRIITRAAGAPYLKFQDGKWAIGGETAVTVECRSYPCATEIVEYLELKPGLEGADGLEAYFSSSGVGFPRSFCMMLVPHANVILLLGEAHDHESIGGRLREWTALSANDLAKLFLFGRTAREAGIKRERAAEMAARLTNESCSNRYGAAPFSLVQFFDPEFVDDRLHYRAMTGHGCGDYLAEVFLTPDLSNHEVRVTLWLNDP